MTNHPKFTASHDSAARSTSYEEAKGTRVATATLTPTAFIYEVREGDKTLFYTSVPWTGNNPTNANKWLREQAAKKQEEYLENGYEK